ncbi:MAG TPA: MarR family transcriptional regulator [Candidatus Paceibacterota bacterium]|nr:MarR family transcriptional regulator [Candidatus Paceibacterota bacterium]
MEIDEKLMSVIFETSRVVKARIQKASIGRSFSYGQMHVLNFIETKGGANMKEVAGFLRVKPPTATAITDGLVKSGMLTRLGGRKDRRVVKMEVTIKGKKFLSDSFKVASGELKNMFSCLGQKDKVSLIKILSKIKE